MGKTSFGRLSAKRRRESLAYAEQQTGRPAHLLEKDVWVVQTMSVLFATQFGSDLVLKGGTSLSKAYDVIRRFSEDIDVTYDIRAFAPEIVSHSNADNAGYDPLPPNRSQAQRWSRLINSRLTSWVAEIATPAIKEGMETSGFDVAIKEEGHRLFVAYKPAFEGHSFVKPQVMIDFGARSSGAPNQVCEIICDAAPSLPGLVLPTSTATVMLPERTFWEKATAMHVFCSQERVRGERFSRHWHDVVELDRAGYGDRAALDGHIAAAVAHHKSVFFREKDCNGDPVDYLNAVAGNLCLVPDGKARDALALDYERMRASGMLLEEGGSFEQLLEQCTDIESRVNRLVTEDGNKIQAPLA